MNQPQLFKGQSGYSNNPDNVSGTFQQLTQPNHGGLTPPQGHFNNRSKSITKDMEVQTDLKMKHINTYEKSGYQNLTNPTNDKSTTEEKKYSQNTKSDFGQMFQASREFANGIGAH